MEMYVCRQMVLGCWMCLGSHRKPNILSTCGFFVSVRGEYLTSEKESLVTDNHWVKVGLALACIGICQGFCQFCSFLQYHCERPTTSPLSRDSSGDRGLLKEYPLRKERKKELNPVEVWSHVRGAWRHQRRSTIGSRGSLRFSRLCPLGATVPRDLRSKNVLFDTAQANVRYSIRSVNLTRAQNRQGMGSMWAGSIFNESWEDLPPHQTCDNFLSLTWNSHFSSGKKARPGAKNHPILSLWARARSSLRRNSPTDLGIESQFAPAVPTGAFHILPEKQKLPANLQELEGLLGACFSGRMWNEQLSCSFWLSRLALSPSRLGLSLQAKKRCLAQRGSKLRAQTGAMQSLRHLLDVIACAHRLV